MLNFLTNDLFLYVAVLIGGLVSLLYARLVLLPRRQHKQAQKKVDEIVNRKALTRLKEIQVAENNANDPWSRTHTRDTMCRELTLAQRRSLEDIGQ